MEGLDFSVVYDNLLYLWHGLQFSLLLTAIGFAVGLILGTGLALVRHNQLWKIHAAAIGEAMVTAKLAGLEPMSGGLP